MIEKVLAAITALGNMATALLNYLKSLPKSPAAQDSAIDQEVSKERQEAEGSGKPQ